MGIGIRPTEAVRESYTAGTGSRRKRSFEISSNASRTDGTGWMASGSNMLQRLVESNAETRKGLQTEEITEEVPNDRSEAVKVYEAALKGSKISISDIRSHPKVPYGYLAKDGVITYNGVEFICDERTNSICLGDVTDKKQVINIPLSGGGHLKVNRANLDQLSKAIGMFTPEDVNLILRAIHLDAKLQSVQNEMEDLEADAEEEIASGSDPAETDGSTEEN